MSDALKVGIDVRYLSHGLVGGVHTYVYQFVAALAQLETPTRFVLYADTKREFELQNLPANFEVRYLPWRNKLDTVRLDASFAKLTAADKLNVLHFPANYGFGAKGVPTLITLHDAINIFPLWEATKRDLKKPKTIAQTLYLQAFTRASLRRSAGIITVSEHAAHNIVDVSKGKIRRKDITVIHSAPSPEFRVINDLEKLAEVRQRLQLPEKFLLADGLKNPGVIIRAWERLPQALRDEYRLVFFSRRPDLLPAAMEAIKDGKVQHILRPTTPDLVAMYNLASLFLFPSWIEGFGLPILEAMSCGVPVVASDRGSIPEIGGKAALYHDAEDDARLAQILSRLLNETTERHKLRLAGLERASQFSWNSTARQLLALYTQTGKRH